MSIETVLLNILLVLGAMAIAGGISGAIMAIVDLVDAKRLERISRDLAGKPANARRKGMGKCLF
jgi:hypothetical protein